MIPAGIITSIRKGGDAPVAQYSPLNRWAAGGSSSHTLVENKISRTQGGNFWSFTTASDMITPEMTVSITSKVSCNSGSSGVDLGLSPVPNDNTIYVELFRGWSNDYDVWWGDDVDSNNVSVSAVASSYFLRIDVAIGEVKTYSSPDGEEWTLRGSYQIHEPMYVTIGLYNAATADLIMQKGLFEVEENIPGELKIGTGTGNLTIDGSSSQLDGINVVKIRPGSYGWVTVRNIDRPDGNPLVIQPIDGVHLANVYFNNNNNVSFSGKEGTGVRNFRFETVDRPIQIGAGNRNLTIEWLYLYNAINYTIYGDARYTQYDGTRATRNENIRILNNEFVGCTEGKFFGELTSSGDFNYVEGIEIAYNTWRDSSAGHCMDMGNVQNYLIHHNKIDNYNANNNNHNGLFKMFGSGKCHTNKATNYQGNLIRAWLYNRIGIGQGVELYNNIGFSSRMYGLLELQAFQSSIIQGVSSVANAKVYNNTAISMSTEEFWIGLLLDIYSLNGGTVEYYNNLGANLWDGSDGVYQSGDMINLQGASQGVIIENRNNYYFVNPEDAVYDLVDFVPRGANNAGADISI